MVGGREEEEGKYVVSSLALARVLLLDRQLYLSLFIPPPAVIIIINNRLLQ